MWLFLLRIYIPFAYWLVEYNIIYLVWNHTNVSFLFICSFLLWDYEVCLWSQGMQLGMPTVLWLLITVILYAYGTAIVYSCIFILSDWCVIFPFLFCRDIFPVLRNATTFKLLTEVLVDHVKTKSPDVEVIVGLESRGFLFGPIMAQELGVSFVPVRKAGKLPGETIQVTYSLEYGQVSTKFVLILEWQPIRILVQVMYIQCSDWIILM